MRQCFEMVVSWRVARAKSLIGSQCLLSRNCEALSRQEFCNEVEIASGGLVSRR